MSDGQLAYFVTFRRGKDIGGGWHNKISLLTQRDAVNGFIQPHRYSCSSMLHTGIFSLSTLGSARLQRGI